VSLDIRWVSLFADVPAPLLEPAVAFWELVTGCRAGTPSGDQREYLPLMPLVGDPVFWLQRVGRDIGGWHLDLHVPDTAAAARAAVQGGAQVTRDWDSLVVLASPAGLPFCLVLERQPARTRPEPPSWPAIGRSLVDQLCLDLPADVHDDERAFWTELTGWSYTAGGMPEFSRLTPPPSLPIQLLFQRLGADDSGGIRAHLDMSADDPSGEVARHMSLGASVAREAEHWTVLRDPAGLIYCVTHRRPLEPPH